MSVTHATATRNTLADYVVDQLASGTIKYVTSGDVEVATCTFAETAFGAASSDTDTADSIRDDTSAKDGTIEKFEHVRSGSTAIVIGGVTATSGGGDIEISSNAITHRTSRRL